MDGRVGIAMKRTTFLMLTIACVDASYFICNGL